MMLMRQMHYNSIIGTEAELNPLKLFQLIG